MPSLVKAKYDYKKLERSALELAEGCEVGAREALLDMAARYRSEAAAQSPRTESAGSRLPGWNIAQSAKVTLSTWLHLSR